VRILHCNTELCSVHGGVTSAANERVFDRA